MELKETNYFFTLSSIKYVLCTNFTGNLVHCSPNCSHKVLTKSLVSTQKSWGKNKIKKWSENIFIPFDRKTGTNPKGCMIIS